MKTDLEQLQQARQRYESIPVPIELEHRLQQTIDQHPYAAASIVRRKQHHCSLVVAACIAALFAAFSLNPAIAQSVADVPLLGSISRVFTVQTWLQQDAGTSVQITQPALDGDSALAQSVNAQIDQLVTQHTAQAQQRLDEYREAFLATGGTEEAWIAHDLHVNIDYQIMSQNSRYLSFVLTSVEDWSSAYSEQYYYNIDLTNNKLVTLADILGEQYVQLANDNIAQQMTDRVKADSNLTYFSADQGGFTSVDDTTHFYINEAGNPVIVFDPYTVAPGFMGIQEFEIIAE